MANEEQLAILKQGADVWNKWRWENLEENIDLSGADLSRPAVGLEDFSDFSDFSEVSDFSRTTLIGADLSEANLSGADLSRMNLSGANLSGADLNTAQFIEADLSDADLSEAKLIKANLSEADLIWANLRESNLSEAILIRTNLSEANLSEANLVRANLSGANLINTNLNVALVWGTVFANVDLSMVQSLDCVNHLGPSTVGIDSLLRSGGSIPESFLEGCGVPDAWIEYLPSLLGKPIDFFSCFISYSHQDEEFCNHLHSRMRAEKLRVWYAPEDIKGGKKIYDQISGAIKLHDKLLIVLSEKSMNSEWVKTEIRKARKREIEQGRQVLFPIRLVSMKAIYDWTAFDSDIGKDMAVEIREYYIPDFRGWKDFDSFEKAYQRLMKDFKPTPE